MFVSQCNFPVQVQVEDLSGKVAQLQAENKEVRDALQKESQAAVEAEEQCTKLDTMKQKLEDEVTVSTIISCY